MSRLRKISIHVIEPEPRRFLWVLGEIAPGSDRTTELERSAKSASTYRQAMAEGLLQLQSIVPDLDLGPRAGAGDAADARRTTASSAAQDDGDGPARLPAAKKRPFFGFGPVR